MEHRYTRRQNPKGFGNIRLLWICGGLVALLLAVILIISLSAHITLDINGGQDPLVLVYGKDTYREPGATASVNGKVLEVDIFSTVDSEKLGTYEVTYRAQYLWMSETVVRQVQVVDITAPVITLHSIPGHLTLPGQAYQEEGYTATDDYDGNITDKVQVSQEGDTVTYTVVDSSGNKTTQTRQILRKDTIAPVLSLLGNERMAIKAGAAFADPGFTATDNVDGDVSAKVQVSGTVNVYHAGEYTLTYTVTDQAGNTTTAQRTVTVEPIKQPETVRPGGKVIYLTFDDGPSPHTQKLLDVLNQYNAKATFFVVDTGYNMSKLLNGMVNGGHSIGIHSVDHDYSKIYASEEAFFKDLYGMQKIIKDYTGVTTTLMRFPGGSSNTVSKKYCPGIMSKLVQAVTDQGFQFFDWNVDSNDAGGAKTADEVFQNVVNRVGNGKTAFVLQHDTQKFSVEAVEKIIIWGLQNGYTFQALTSSSPTFHHVVNN